MAPLPFLVSLPEPGVKCDQPLPVEIQRVQTVTAPVEVKQRRRSGKNGGAAGGRIAAAAAASVHDPGVHGVRHQAVPGDLDVAELEDTDEVSTVEAQLRNARRLVKDLEVLRFQVGVESGDLLADGFEASGVVIFRQTTEGQ